MDLNSIPDRVLQYFLANRILSDISDFTLNTGAVTTDIGTAIARVHNGLVVAPTDTGDDTPTGGPDEDGVTTIAAQAIGTTYYVLTLTSAASAAFRLYKGDDGVDAFKWNDLQKAFERGEIPILVLKAVATAAWTPLTDFWSDADVTVTGALVAGQIPVAKPSSLTFGTIVT